MGVKSRVQTSFSLLAGICLAFLPQPAAAAAPETGVWAVYRPTTASSSVAASGTPGVVTIGHGHGALPIFGVQLRAAPRGPGIMAALVSPANYDAYELDAGRVDEESVGDEPDQQAEYAFERLRTALDRHRPAAPIRVDQAGAVEILWTPVLRRHVRCARRLLGAAAERGLALADENDRGWWRSPERSSARVAGPRTDAAATLLRLLMLEMPQVSDGRWARFERESAAREAESSRRYPPNQYDWRSAQIRAAGREFALEVDLIRDRNSAAARLCRTIRVQGAAVRASDRCSISGFLDTRDGWPIVISFGRTVEGGGEMRWRGTTYYRLAPLAGFVALENPCAG